MSGERPPPGYLPGLGKPRHERSRSSSPASEQPSRSRSSSTGSSSESGDSQTSPNDSHESQQQVENAAGNTTKRIPIPPVAPAKAQEDPPGTVHHKVTSTDPPTLPGGMLPRRSPRTEHEFNVLMCERLRASGYVSKGLLQHIATYLVDEEKAAKSDPTAPTYAEEEAILALAKNPLVLPVATRPQRRLRSPEDENDQPPRSEHAITGIWNCPNSPR
ncbi:hypothetical protein O0L34_g18666 [Tuta absoluta]|nr:hypothetical protein O0L34_g18666 [Tuta absoluta]